MRVIGALGRASARGRTSALVGLAAVVALGAGAALGALAIGARTDRAYPDHLRRAEVAEVVVNPSLGTELAESTIASTEGVLSYATDDILTASFDDGAPRTQSEVDSVTAVLRMSTDGRFLRQDRPVVEEGRLPRAGAREAFLGREAAEALGVSVGDELPIAFWAPSYTTGNGAGQQDLVEPLGRSSATVVGIGLFADEVLSDGLFPQERVLVTPEAAERFTCTYNDPAELDPDVDLDTAFAAVVPAGCSFAYRFFAIQTEDDAAARRVVDDLTAAFQAENERIPEALRSVDVGYIVIPAFAAQERERIDQALAPTVAALTAFGWGAATATLVLALLQALRWTRRLGPDVEVWRSVGVGRSARTLALALPLGMAVIVGLLGAAIVGWGASSMGAVGSAAAIDPDGPRIPLDVAVTALLGVAGVLLLLLAVVAGGASANPRPRPDRPGILGTLVQRLEPARAAGVRAASRGGGAGAVLAGSTVAVAVVLASGVFTANVTALIDAPNRFGWPYDAAVMVGFGYGGADLDVVEGALADDDVVRWGAASTGAMTIDGESVPTIAAQRGFDQLDPVVTSGRLPESDDEIALGRATLHELGVELGDRVEVSSYFGERAAVVTGTVVLPGLGPYESDRASSGTGAWLPTAWFEALVGEAEVAAGIPPGSLLSTTTSFIGIDLDEGVDPEAFLADQDLLAWDQNGFDSPTYSTPVLPADLVELDDMRRVPIALGAVFAAAMAIGLGLGVAAAARSRRVELATMRALGFSPRQLSRSIRWQALTTVAIAALVGVPLGVAAGRALARAFLTDLGVDTQVVTPVPFVVAVAIGAIAIAEAASALPARRAARNRLTVPSDA